MCSEDGFVTRMGDGRCARWQWKIFRDSSFGVDGVVLSAAALYFNASYLTVYVVRTIDAVDSGIPPTIIDTIVQRGVGVVCVKIKELAGVRRVSASISRRLFRGV